MPCLNLRAKLCAMLSRMSAPSVGRKNVPLSQRDLEDLENMRSGDSPERRALLEIANNVPLTSESAVMRAVLEIGIARVHEVAEAAGYRQLAQEYAAEQETRRAIRDSRVARRVAEGSWD